MGDVVPGGSVGWARGLRRRGALGQAVEVGWAGGGSAPDEGEREEYEAAYQEIVQSWVDEVTSLGCEVKRLWLVDWDNGGGYYCWRYPEESLGFFHTYEDGFQGRIPIN